MNKIVSILAASTILLLTTNVFAQTNDRLKKAEALFSDYIEASKFEENGHFAINEKTRNSFLSMFKKDAKIIFDVPIANYAGNKNELKKYGGPERQQSEVIPAFGKEVSPQKYVDILEKEIDIDEQIDILVIPTGKKDISGIDTTGIVVFEFEKSFSEKDSLNIRPKKYLVKIDASGRKPVITAIRRNDEDIIKRNVLIQLYSDSRPVANEDTITCLVKLEFPERINNVSDMLESYDGRIRLDQVANRAIIKIKSATDREAVEYVVPSDWSTIGKRVSEQPEDGFEVNLLPKSWNGLAFTIDIHGGIFQQSSVNTNNFSNDSEFGNDPGYRFGGEFLVTKYFNPVKWKHSGWLIGIGAGLNISYQWAVTRSSGFIQNKYEFIDAVNDTVHPLIQFSGSDFKETVTRLDIAIPIYLDFRTRLSKKASMTVQPGINVIFPFQISYKAEGNFSRWGYYDAYNEKPITDDPFYNYFTDEPRTYEDQGTYSFQLEGQLRLNFLINVFKKNPDNALIIGLIGSIPLSNSPTYNYSQGIAEYDYNGYWISTENEDYHSLIYSRERPYNLFFGLSVGINLVKYKTK